MGGGESSQTSTWESANRLSAGALDEQDSLHTETALTGLGGQVALDYGIASFAGLSFFRRPRRSCPYAGTYR